ncbi:MAG: cryptochrome/photolyase family protein [Pseudomonadota bacterium]
MTRNLVLILGDQLSHNLSSLQHSDPGKDRILMAEVMDEATYVRHHKKKIAFVFAAMRHFAVELREAGWTVDYVRIDDPDNPGSLNGALDDQSAKHNPDKILLTEPGEWRLAELFRKMEIDILPDDRFLCTPDEFADWADGRKQLRMEYFYREMRRKTGLLMNGNQPAEGKWNFDSENRKPAKSELFMPQPSEFAPDAMTSEILRLIAERFGNHFGDLHSFSYAVTREHALQALDHFVETTLPHFGDYQDAMLDGEPFLYHSILAQYLNCGLLLPLEICQKVEQAYRDGLAPINAAEGYIRQIIGWREYIRGIYWLKMPEYVDDNYFEHDRPLPDFYWTGETDMTCIRAAVTQTKELAYAHHIQRLMVTGNFAMLCGIDPAEVHEWYLAVYADAYEWVELPNTIGMSQFADGGVVASKPYAASGAYINRMSNYCGSCRYDVKQRTGDNACPFNALYWNFVAAQRDKLGNNPRMGPMYRTWDRFEEEEQKRITDGAAKFLETL